MSEMVERVARVLSATMDQDDDWKPYEAAARATIEALREPTEAMLKEGGSAGGWDAEWAKDNTPTIWQAMIDEALSQTTPSARATTR